MKSFGGIPQVREFERPVGNSDRGDCFRVTLTCELLQVRPLGLPVLVTVNGLIEPSFMSDGLD